MERRLKEVEIGERDIKKVPGLSQGERISKKFEAISYLRKDYSVDFYVSLGVSASGYYAHFKTSKIVKFLVKNVDLLTRIKRVYFFTRVRTEPNEYPEFYMPKGTLVNHKKVARIMNEANFKAKVTTSKDYHEALREICRLCL